MGTAQSVAFKRVMLVEDDAAIADIVKIALEMFDVTCVTFGSVEELPDLLNPNHQCGSFCRSFDGKIFDRNLPGMGGDEFLKKLSASHCCLKYKPTVLSTASHDIGYVHDFCQHNAITLVKKPFLTIASLYAGLVDSSIKLQAGKRF